MITSVRFCLSYDLLNANLSPSDFVYLNEEMSCCNGGHDDLTFWCRKCYITFGHSIIYDMTLSTE